MCAVNDRKIVIRSLIISKLSNHKFAESLEQMIYTHLLLFIYFTCFFRENKILAKKECDGTEFEKCLHCGGQDKNERKMRRANEGKNIYLFS